MPAARRTPALELFWRVHRWVFQVSNGRIGSRLLGHTVLLLNTTGRKSGKPRSNTLYTFPYEDSYVVIASNAGDVKYPAWYHNLRANPEATVLLGGKQQKVVAREAAGEERERLWDMIVAKDASYAEYQSRVTREIPVIVLDPIDEA